MSRDINETFDDRQSFGDAPGQLVDVERAFGFTSGTDFIRLLGDAPYTISDDGSFSVLTLGSVSITFADTILTTGDFL